MAELDKDTEKELLVEQLDKADAETEFNELEERARPKRGWSGWSGIFLIVALGLAPVLLYVHKHHKAKPGPSTVAGWQELGSCFDSISFDRTREMILEEKGIAHLTWEDADRKEISSTGKWTFNPGTRRYAVVFNGVTDEYQVTATKDFCMLVKGDVAAADLKASWFAFDTAPPPDDRDRPDPD